MHILLIMKAKNLLHNFQATTHLTVEHITPIIMTWATTNMELIRKTPRTYLSHRALLLQEEVATKAKTILWFQIVGICLVVIQEVKNVNIRIKEEDLEEIEAAGLDLKANKVLASQSVQDGMRKTTVKFPWTKH